MPFVVGEHDVETQAVTSHTEGWDLAMEDAFDKAKRFGYGGQHVKVQLSAVLSNPSQIQRYIVTLS